MIGEAELLVHGVDEVHHAHDLVGELLRRHKQVRVVLVEAAHAEEAVQRAPHLVTVHEADLAGANGQLAIAMRTALVHEHAARAVHGLNAVLLVIDDGGVHVVLVVVPVARGLPQMLAHNLRRGNFNVAGLAVDLAPVVQELVLEDHAVGQEERETGGLIAHHEEVHLAADLAVVAALGLLEHLEMLHELVLRGERGAVHTGEHLVRAIGLPVSTRYARKLEGLEPLGVGKVRSHAHVDVVTLLVEGDAGVFGQVADVLDLVLLAPLLHEGDGFFARQLEHGELQILLHDATHLVLDGGQIVLGKGLVAQIDIVVETALSSGTVGEVGFGVQALDGLRHDMRGAVAHDVRDLVCRALIHVAVVIENLHRKPLPLRYVATISGGLLA